MLKFYRKEFKAGVIIAKEKIVVEGQPDQWAAHKFYPRDNGRVDQYQNEPYLLEKYPVLFTLVET